MIETIKLPITDVTKFLIAAISTDKSRVLYNSVWVDPEYIVATDGKHLRIIPNNFKVDSGVYTYEGKLGKSYFFTRNEMTAPNWRKKYGGVLVKSPSEKLFSFVSPPDAVSGKMSNFLIEIFILTGCDLDYKYFLDIFKLKFSSWQMVLAGDVVALTAKECWMFTARMKKNYKNVPIKIGGDK